MQKYPSMQLPYNRQGYPQIFWNILNPGPFLFNSCLSIPQTQFSGRSRPSVKGGGPGHPEPKIRRGRSQKKCFLGPSDIAWSKIKGDRSPAPPPRAPPLYPPLHFANFSKRWLLRIEDLTS